MITYLDLGSDMEEGEISGDEVVGDASSFILDGSIIRTALTEYWEDIDTYKDVNLALQDVLGLFKVVVSRSRGACLDLVEPWGEVAGGVLGIGADGVEVCDGGVLTGRQRDELRASALDDGERDESRH